MKTLVSAPMDDNNKGRLVAILRTPLVAMQKALLNGVLRKLVK